MTTKLTRSALLAASTVAAAAASLAGCSSVRQAVGAEKVTPDEFRVVTKAPLVVPPEYNLRPPAPGEPRPEDLLPDDLADSSLYNGYESTTASNAEQLLVAKLSANGSDPTVRLQIDAEAGVVQKRRGFANRVLFWQDGDVADEANPTQTAAADEIERRARMGEAATGTAEVEIGRRGKLPGL
jgi:hypothetical protein